MPTKYSDRLNLSFDGDSNIVFSTKNGLKIAAGYVCVKFFPNGKPMIEFMRTMIQEENIFLPENQKWRVKNSNFQYLEYKSKDFCKVKILQNKRSKRYYISPFDLISDKIPVLIAPLHRRKTILATA